MRRGWLIGSVGLLLLASSPAGAQTLTLAEALDRAEAQSPLVDEARAGVEAARGRARQAGVSPNPELSLEIENIAGSGDFRGARGAEATLAIGQRIELGGKRGARRDVAAAELNAADLRLTLARAEVARNVREAFAELSIARARVILTEENASVADELARTADVLVTAGRDPPLRVARARAAAAQAQADLQAAQATAEAAGRALAATLGTEAQIESLSASVEPVRDIGDPADVIDVRLATAELRAAEARVRLERTVATPDVTAQIGVRRLNETDDTAMVFGLSVPIPLRDRNGGAVEAAAAEARAAEARLAQARLGAFRTLRDAQTNLAAADARVTALATAGLNEAQEALRLARLGYEAGKFTLVDVLDAQRALVEAQSALLDARLARERAVAVLARAAAR